jgi:preprotein translocase subunit SecA
MHTEVLEGLFTSYVPVAAYVDDWDLAGLTDAIQRQYGVHMALTPEHVAEFDREAFLEHLHTSLQEQYTAKMQPMGPEQRGALERWVMLQVIDKHWKDHLLAMDYLKEGIGLRGYGQKNPLNEYKREAYEMFVGMTERLKAEVLELLFKIELTHADEELTLRPRRREQHIIEHRGTPAEGQDEAEMAIKTVRRQGAKVGRNAPCPCGSGKKYKKCCGV